VFEDGKFNKVTRVFLLVNLNPTGGFYAGFGARFAENWNGNLRGGIHRKIGKMDVKV